ncbi:hypothetical protein ACO0LC_23955 [Undibacterium sp. JH2W]|uniref:hypothetical protein n=1 Tax=Undibacterium sp. JH2W TaxID=3413037 RepID=UPI003BF360A0
MTGSGTSTLKLDGPIEYINSFIAANKLSFTSALHDHTDVTLNMMIDDNGYWYTSDDQNPVHLTDQKTATIKVTHINQVPVITSSTGAVQFVEGNNTPSAAVKIDTALTLTDADNTNLSSATVAQWQAALRAVSYTNSSETPDTSTRDISYSANDDSNTSAVVNKQVAVTAINDCSPVT